MKELRHTREDLKRCIEKQRELELDNDKIKKENHYLIQKTETDIQKL